MLLSLNQTAIDVMAAIVCNAYEVMLLNRVSPYLSPYRSPLELALVFE